METQTASRSMAAWVQPSREKLPLLKLKEFACRKDVGSEFTTLDLKTAEGHSRCPESGQATNRPGCLHLAPMASSLPLLSPTHRLD